MRRFCTIVVFLTALMFFVTSVNAAEQASGSSKNQFYVGILGGFAIPQSVSATPNDGSNHASMDIAVNNGFLVGVKGGWIPKAARGFFATELEYNYVRYNSDNNNKIPERNTIFADAIDTTFSANNIFLNFILRYPDTIFHPYIGIGPGWSWFNAGNTTVTTYMNGVSLGSFSVESQSSNQFIYQVMLGIDVDVTDNIGVGLGYKFSQTKPSLSGGGNNSWNADLDAKNHVITLGVKYSF